MQIDDLSMLFNLSLSDQALEEFMLGLVWESTNDKLGFVWEKAQMISTFGFSEVIYMGMPYFIEIFMIAAWEIWNLRNAKIFEGQAMSFQLHKV